MPTYILPEDVFSMFPEQHFTPVDKAVEVVMMLLDGSSKRSDGGSEEPSIGHSGETSGRNHYFCTQYDFSGEPMAALMGAIEL